MSVYLEIPVNHAVGVDVVNPFQHLVEHLHDVGGC